MSELSDLATALGAISKSLTSIEAHTAQSVANGEQLRLGLHDLRNKVQEVLLDSAGKEGAIRQVQTWMGDFSSKLGALTERLDNAAAVRLSDVKELRDRVRELEQASGVEEVTKA